MDICHVELNGWTTGALSSPHEEIFQLMLLKVEIVVARLLKAHVVNDCRSILPVDFVLFLSVGQHVEKVVDQVSESATDTS